MSDTPSKSLKILQPDIQIIKKPNNWCPIQVIKQTCNAVEKLVLPIKSAGKPCMFCIKLTTSDEVQKLNFEYRDKNKPTNVLSFETGDCIEDKIFPFVNLGDIIISNDVLLSEAREKNIQEGYHLAHLVTHGLLHLYGLDHINDDEAEIMENAEIAILASMNIANPYIIK